MKAIFYPKEKLEDTKKYILSNKRAQYEINKKKININRLEKNEFIFINNWDMERTNKPYKFIEEIKWNFYPENDPEWTYILNRHKFLEDIGQLYLLEKDRKYYLLFKRLLKSWLEQEGKKEIKNFNVIQKQNKLKKILKKIIPLKIKLVIEKYNKLKIANKAETWRTLDVALRLETWLKLLEVFKENLIKDKEFYEEIKESLNIQANYLLNFYDEFHRPISNWGTIQNISLYIIGLILEKKEYIIRAKDRLKENLELQISEDGMHIEQSPMYHNEVLLGCLNLINTLKKTNNQIPNWLEEKTKSMLYADFKLMKPNRNQPVLGDSDDTNLKDIFTLGAIILNDGFIKKYAFKELDMNIIYFIGLDAIENFEKLKEENKVIDKEKYQLPRSGNFVLRSGWEQKDNYLLFHNGFYGGGHSHSQNLHIELQNRGEDVLIDSGRYTYVETNYRKKLKSQYSHNTLVINKKDIVKPISSWGFESFPELLNSYSYFSQNYEYIEQGYSYDYFISGKKNIFRKILYIKPDIYVILDQVIGRGKNLCEQYFHFDNKGNISLEKDKVIYETTENITEFYFLENSINLNLEDSIISKEYNKLEKSKKVKVTYKSKKIISLITVIKLNSKKEKKEIILTDKKIYKPNGEQCSVDEAQGIYIRYDNNEYLITIRNKQNEENRFNRIEGIPIFGEINVIKNMKDREKVK